MQWLRKIGSFPISSTDFRGNAIRVRRPWCVPCQKEKSREDLGYFLLDRRNWRQEAEKMLSAPLRYYGVDDSEQMRSRNRAWADRFVELTKEKQRLTTFVGVAHLVGASSFIEELEKKGFTVTEIPWTDQDE